LPSEAVVVLSTQVVEEPANKSRRGINSRVSTYSKPGKAMVYRYKKDMPPNKDDEEMAAEIEDFIGITCRQVTIDRIMDGNLERIGCVDGEEACDMCEDRQHSHRFVEERVTFWTASRDDITTDQPDHQPDDDMVHPTDHVVKFACT
jgi:hypothetical protein